MLAFPVIVSISQKSVSLEDVESKNSFQEEKKLSTYNAYQKALIKTKAALMLAWLEWLESTK